MSRFNDILADALDEFMGRKQLKPCPFCGGKAIIFQIPYNTTEELHKHPSWFWNNPGWFTVGCETEMCIASVNHEMMLFINSKQAEEAWNRRIIEKKETD